MKTTAIRNLALGTLCASMIGAAGLASAASQRVHFYHGGGIVRSYGYGPRFGLGLGVVIGGPAYVAPAYVEPAYVDPYYVAPYVSGGIVLGGGGYWGGGHYYRGGGYVRGGGFAHGGGYARGGGYSHSGRH